MSVNIYLVASSNKSCQKFLSGNKFLRGKVKFVFGNDPFYVKVQKIIERESSVCLILRENVITTANFAERVCSLVDKLNKEYPSWGLASNSGISTFPPNLNSDGVVNFSVGGDGAPNSKAEIVPAQTVNGDVLLLNIPKIKEKLNLSKLDGAGLVEIVLSVELIKNGLSVLLCPDLYLFRDGFDNKKKFDDKVISVLPYLNENLKNNKLTTLYGCIKLKGNLGNGIDLPTESISVCRTSATKDLAIVVRTSGKRKTLLERAVLTALSLSCYVGSLSLNIYVVCGKDTDIDSLKQQLKRQNVNIIRFNTSKKDNRFELIKFSAEALKEKYIWFLDDDDWLFPNGAGLLSAAITAFLDDKTFFLQALSFQETLEDESEMFGFLRQSRVFPAKEFVKNFTGLNHTPLSCCIFPREALAQEIQDKNIEEITYLEDYFLILKMMLRKDFSPCVIDLPFVGISLRSGKDQSVLAEDRTIWEESELALYEELLPQISFLSSQLAKGFVNSEARLESRIDEILNSRSWRITRPIRGVAAFFRKIKSDFCVKR